MSLERVFLDLNHGWVTLTQWYTLYSLVNVRTLQSHLLQLPKIQGLGHISFIPHLLLLGSWSPGFTLLIAVVYLRLPWWLGGKESACECRSAGSIPGPGRSPGKGNGNALQYSCLGNPIDRGAWRATIHGTAKSQTQLQLSTTVPILC